MSREGRQGGEKWLVVLLGESAAADDTLHTYKEASQPFQDSRHATSAFMWKMHKIMSSLQDFFGVPAGLHLPDGM